MKVTTALVLCIGFIIFIVFLCFVLFPESTQEEPPDRESLVITIVNLTKQIGNNGVELGKKLKNEDILKEAVKIKHYMQIKDQNGELNRENIAQLFACSRKLSAVLSDAAGQHGESKNELKKLIATNDNLKNSIIQLQQQRI